MKMQTQSLRNSVRSSVEHPTHKLSKGLDSAIHKATAAKASMRALQFELERASVFTQEELAKLGSAENGQSVYHHAEQREEIVRKALEDRRIRIDRIKEMMRSQFSLQDAFRPPVDPSPPQPKDSGFWWAKTEWEIPEDHTDSKGPFYSEMSASFGDHGLRINGRISSLDNDIHHFHVRITSWFDVQAERIQPSASGKWLSAPHVELMGALTASTGKPDYFSSDIWSKCVLHRTQTVWQMRFAGQAVQLGERHAEPMILIDEVNANRPFTANLPGFLPMPELVLDNIDPSYPVTSELELYFDISLRGRFGHIEIPAWLEFHPASWVLTPAS